MYRLLTAVLYLKSRPIMWISVIGVMLGVGSILVVDSIWNGFIREVSIIARGANSDILITTAQLRTPYTTLRTKIEEVDGVSGVARRLLRWGVIRTDREFPAMVGIAQISHGPVIQLQGIVLAEESRVSNFEGFLRQAPKERAVADPKRPFDLPPGNEPQGPAGPFPIIVGEKLAEVMELSRLDRLSLLTLSSEMEVDDEGGFFPPQAEFVVAGTFRTNKYDIDLTTAYLQLEDLQRFAQLPRGDHEIAVKKTDAIGVDELKARLVQHLAPEVKDYRIKTWAETQRSVIGAVENQRAILNLILFFIVVVAGFNLLVTLRLMVTEKLSDIGTLVSMGASSLGIASIFTSCGLLVSLVGSGLGLGFGFLIAKNINPIHEVISRVIGRPLFTEEVYGITEIPVLVDPTRIGIYLAATVLCTILFASYASLKAGRLNAVDALRAD